MNLSKIKTEVYICHCGTNIAGKVDVGAVAEYCTASEYCSPGTRLHLHVFRPWPGF